ncbi:hypothetical protein CEXT_416511 [Caerostris extrusa]|uniref:Uncharacterized protein n=1 Tax=Caerostris extrusa TaxID=172846 RepID=A0AAV4Y7I4_CAEEX|nr:hypothetical protein CEXT_416511 [Caerostris extrusa]
MRGRGGRWARGRMEPLGVHTGSKISWESTWRGCFRAKGYFSSEPLNCHILFSAIHSTAETVISPIDVRAKAAGRASIHTDSTADKKIPLINMGS